ncbi:MAG TPA: autotransporter outer membrane beta-barrel domain-containing protein, partial [Rhabdochlamydiaceae bacterium]
VVPTSGIAVPITISGSGGALIISVAINASGQGMIGGSNNADVPYAAFVSPSGTAAPINIVGIGANGFIYGVAINDSGQGILGGQDSTGVAYAAIVPTSGIAIPINIGTTLPFSEIYGVAINDSGQGLIGGTSSEALAYAAFVSSSGVAMPIAMPTGLSGDYIYRVAINDIGQGIIGGQAGNNDAYAALVFPSGEAIPIATGLSDGFINGVAINNFGQGLIGGQDSAGNAYAAIVSSFGIATPINIGVSNGQIFAVSMNAFLPFLSQIPTGSLSGNNLIFANYINKNAPQDSFYFVPAYFDGTLKQALESAAPTRNAFSVFAACNNLFYLTTGLSNHLHNHPIHRRAGQTFLAAVSSGPKNWRSEDQLLASMSLQKPKQAAQASVAGIPSESENQLISFISPEMRRPTNRANRACLPECPEEKNNSIWFEAIGAVAYQKAQDQTPAFNPSTGGAIFAYDGKTSEQSRVGGGATYLFTHVHEKQGAGHSNINQEDLFVYASWENKQFYVDGAVLGGLFQISQVRKIHMTGFDFTSTSKPHGWQLLPHLELGYHYSQLNCCQDFEVTMNPFVMVDWANTWQGSFKEKGSGPFNAGQKAHHSSLLRTEASLRVYETLFFDAWDLTFQEKVGYVNIHSFGMGKVNAFLVGSPGSFTVETLTSAQNLGVGEFAMIFAPNNSSYPTGTIFYQGEFGVGFQSHQVALELAWNF